MLYMLYMLRCMRPGRDRADSFTCSEPAHRQCTQRATARLAPQLYHGTSTTVYNTTTIPQSVRSGSAPQPLRVRAETRGVRSRPRGRSPAPTAQRCSASGFPRAVPAVPLFSCTFRAGPGPHTINVPGTRHGIRVFYLVGGRGGGAWAPRRPSRPSPPDLLA
jgi:hypothetical protein